MIIPCTQVVYINDVKGHGVIASAHIPKGTVTWVFDELDREFSPDQFNRLSKPCQEAILTYSYRNSRGDLVFCWDNERYINHSFRPNCCLTPYKFEIAVRDIAQGEELTNDYGFLNIIEPFNVDSEGTDRSTVYPDDLLRYDSNWDSLLREALDCFLHVEQPLKMLFPEKTWQTAISIARRETTMTSIKTCYYNKEE
ncbi:MAG: SET domain-containing protein [Desulforhopalus sp.]